MNVYLSSFKCDETLQVTIDKFFLNLIGVVGNGGQIGPKILDQFFIHLYLLVSNPFSRSTWHYMLTVPNEYKNNMSKVTRNSESVTFILETKYITLFVRPWNKLPTL